MIRGEIGLLLVRARDFSHDIGDVLDRLDDLVQCRAGAVHEFDAVLDLTVAVGDEILDVLGRL